MRKLGIVASGSSVIDAIANPIPKQSNVYEEIVKKGWESFKRSKK